MPHDKHYNSPRHKAWAEKVLRRAGYLCEECKRYGRLDRNGLPVRATTAHHIKHRDEYPELQYDVSNGRALCEKCHNKAHPEKGGAHGHYWD
jgi:5-methylcytosine-specific restriction endonuclease McrA